MAVEPAPAPAELRRVERRHLDHGQPDLRAAMEQLDAKRVGEAADGELRRAVGRLERNRPVGEGRADLDDRAAVARHHAAQGGERAVDRAQVVDLGHPPELRRRHVDDLAHHRDHRVVDPHVDRAELALDPLRGLLHPFGVGDVGRHGDRAAPHRLDLPPGAREAVLAAGEQAQVRALGGEGADRGPAHPRRGARHDHHSSFTHALVPPRSKSVPGRRGRARSRAAAPGRAQRTLPHRRGGARSMPGGLLRTGPARPAGARTPQRPAHAPAVGVGLSRP